jgi:hypothetical protein
MIDVHEAAGRSSSEGWRQDGAVLCVDLAGDGAVTHLATGPQGEALPGAEVLAGLIVGNRDRYRAGISRRRGCPQSQQISVVKYRVEPA